ncbi:4682_t:CDS:2, partial [Cetraspora pellucida]
MNDFYYSSPLPYFNTYEYGHTPSASSSSYFNTHDYAQENISSYLNIHDHNDSANTSPSFYSNAYEQDFVNTLQSPDPISSSQLSTNNELVESDADVDTRPCKVDNGVYVDEKGEYDDSENENNEYEDNENEKAQDSLVLYKGMKFKTWELAESHLNDYAKQKGFSFWKRRRVLDFDDNIVIRRCTYECSHAHMHEPEKTVLAENRRNRNSEMI